MSSTFILCLGTQYRVNLFLSTTTLSFYGIPRIISKSLLGFLSALMCNDTDPLSSLQIQINLPCTLQDCLYFPSENGRVLTERVAVFQISTEECISAPALCPFFWTRLCTRLKYKKIRPYIILPCGKFHMLTQLSSFPVNIKTIIKILNFPFHHVFFRPYTKSF